MNVSILNPHVDLDAESRTLVARFQLVNNSSTTLPAQEGRCVGWQLFDPETGTFIYEGEWTALDSEIAPGDSKQLAIPVILPPEKGRYHVYLSLLDAQNGWLYTKGEHFLLIDAQVEHARASLLAAFPTTLRKLRRKQFWTNAGLFFTLPVQALWNNRTLIRSMVRRDVLARYRGSFGDVLWTILNPALLMATYFFVFGIVLGSRLGHDNSRSGFVLYFLAGMLPWLPFSEAVGRSPHVILEHRNFVKKLVFPVETLPANQVFSGLVSGMFALAVFLVGMLAVRWSLPASALLLPILWIPQILFTLGVCWFLSALGVYMRDLSHIIGFLLTLWFFLTPICYPETSLPAWAAPVLSRNPINVLVRGYRDVLLEGHAPAFSAMWKLWLVSLLVFFCGHAWFYKLRKTFADVI